MKKKIMALLLATVMVSSAVAGCGSSSSSSGGNSGASAEASGEKADGGEDYSYSFKLASTENEDYYMVKLSKEFLDKVSEKTDGKVTGEVFASGQLGGLVDMLEGLELGNIDIVNDGFSSLSAMSDLFNVWCLPYLYDSKEHQYAFWDNHFDEVTDLIAEKTGYRLICVIDGMNRELSSSVPVESIDDLKGLKIRVPNIPGYVRIWECLGAAPIPMSLSEVYTSIQTGVVQGQENDIALTLSENFYEVAPYAVMTDHVPYEGTLYFYEETFQSYPEELQQAIREAGKEIMLESREMIKDIEDESMQKINDMGVTVIYPDLEPFKEATKIMYEEYGATEEAARILELVDQARNE